MSISDQAFIRAYHEEAITVGPAPVAAIDIGLGSVIPPPHAQFPPTETKRKQPSLASPPFVSLPVAEIHTVDPSLPKFKPADTEAALYSDIQHGDTEHSDIQHSDSQHNNAPRVDAATPHFSSASSRQGSLSSFTRLTAAEPPTSGLPKPALEIDGVIWPAICETLLAQYGERFDRVALELCREAGTGSKITAITGTRRGEGRTTLALCLARRLAAGNAKVALVDADFSNPSLATQLRIEVDRGWEAVLAGEETLWDVMIESVIDRFAILPLATDAAKNDVAPAAFRVGAIFGELAENYDVVLVDTGPLSQQSLATQWLLETETNIDSIVLAHDVRHAQAHQLAAGCLQLADANQRQLGIVEMFVAEK